MAASLKKQYIKSKKNMVLQTGGTYFDGQDPVGIIETVQIFGQNFKRIPVPGDGNCFFHAIILSLARFFFFDSDMVPLYTRASQYFVENCGYPAKFKQDLLNTLNNSSDNPILTGDIKDRWKRILPDVFKQGEADMAALVELLLKIPVVVYTVVHATSTREEFLRISCYPDEHTVRRNGLDNIYLYADGGHFDALFPEADPPAKPFRLIQSLSDMDTQMRDFYYNFHQAIYVSRQTDHLARDRALALRLEQEDKSAAGAGTVRPASYLKSRGSSRLAAARQIAQELQEIEAPRRGRLRPRQRTEPDTSGDLQFARDLQEHFAVTDQLVGRIRPGKKPPT